MLNNVSIKWNGRFGNQCLQYAFARIFANRYGLNLGTSPWLGQEVFEGVNEEAFTFELPTIEECHFNYNACLTKFDRETPPFFGVNFSGFFQGHSSNWTGVKDEFRSLFRPKKEYLEVVDLVEKSLREKGNPLIILHPRLPEVGSGDCDPATPDIFLGADCYVLPPAAVISEKLRELLTKHPSAVVYVSTNRPKSPKEQFPDLPLIICDDLPLEPTPPHLEIILEFLLMTRADILVGSYSTYSFVPAMLSSTLQTYWRYDAENHAMETIDPWDSYFLRLKKQRNYHY